MRGWVAYYRLVDVEGKLRSAGCVAASEAARHPVASVEAACTRLKKLRQRGVDGARARAGAMNSRGPWWNAGASHMNQAVPNDALLQMGLVSLLDEHQRLACSS